MTENSLYPCFAKVHYRTFKAVHDQTIPLLNWFSTPNVNGSGSISQWDAGTVDVDDVIRGLVNLEKAVMPTTTNFTDYIIYTMADKDAVPQPVAQGLLNIDGTLADDPVAAAQATYTWRTSLFGISKLVLLDIAPPADYQDVLPADYSAGNIALNNWWVSADHGIAGRDGGQPNIPMKISYTLNNRLQKSYKRR